MSPIFLNALISWRLGVRSHAMRALLVLGGALMAVAFLAGSFSLRQPLAVALDMGLSGLRFLGLLMVLFWMQEAFAKDIDRRTVTFALAYPVPRSAYVLGRFLGVIALVVVTVATWGGLLYIMNQFSGWGYEQSSQATFGFGYLLVLLGIILDLVVVGAFFVMVSSVSETPMLPFLAGFGFALSARMLGVMIDYLALAKGVDLDLKNHLLPILEKIRWVLPDLSRLDWRQICLYDTWPPADQMALGASIALGFALMCLGAAVLAYRKRNFT